MIRLTGRALIKLLVLASMTKQFVHAQTPSPRQLTGRDGVTEGIVFDSAQLRQIIVISKSNEAALRTANAAASNHSPQWLKSELRRLHRERSEAIFRLLTTDQRALWRRNTARLEEKYGAEAADPHKMP